MQVSVYYGGFILCHIIIQRLHTNTNCLKENIQMLNSLLLSSYIVFWMNIADLWKLANFSSNPIMHTNLLVLKMQNSKRWLKNHALNHLSVSERQDFAKHKQSSFNCLSHGHTAKFCESNSSCTKCNKRHHTLLHVSFYEDSSSVHINKTHTRSQQLHL